MAWLDADSIGRGSDEFLLLEVNPIAAAELVEAMTMCLRFACKNLYNEEFIVV
jgi:hypothetical protein